MIKILKCLLLTTFLSVLPITVVASPTAKITILVVDNNDIPIENATMSFSFSRTLEAVTGEKGEVTIKRKLKHKIIRSYVQIDKNAKELSESVYIKVNAKGFYETAYRYNGFLSKKGAWGFRKWEPWNLKLKIVLKKKLNPIPMYAYYVDRFHIPYKGDENGYVGFDLMKHDWVHPAGNGIVADLLFKIDKLDNSLGELSVGVSNSGDGIKHFFTPRFLGSILRSDYHAPEDGYKNKVTRKSSTYVESPYYKNNDGPLNNYYFRIRCLNNKSESCFYGKIRGGFYFAEDWITFNYYLNPSIGDKNVEFDVNKNLFKSSRRPSP
ncbi:MAG: hypothetical protein L3J22_09905 [Xanthomonadales bacterium]|nr:hypothetical protein [Xanthomonadales bacterium]